jgi:hypothetical protein
MIISRSRNTFCADIIVLKLKTRSLRHSYKCLAIIDIFDARGIAEGRGFLPVQDPDGR